MLGGKSGFSSGKTGFLVYLFYFYHEAGVPFVSGIRHKKYPPPKHDSDD
jgi:hypothetical protein